jgi:hypothetical protein
MTSKCLACGNTQIENILDFGRQPAANLLMSSPTSLVVKEDLSLDFCLNCGHAQQRSFYSPEVLFSKYLYQSGTSHTLKKYFDWLASSIARAQPANSKVLEIASNDGSFLSILSAHDLICEGVEPAENIAEISRNSGHQVTVGFWPLSLGTKFDVIVAQNVAAHTPSPLSFMRGIFEALSETGVAYIQSSQVEMFKNFEFDTLYHEHFSFYCANSKRILMERAGFKYSHFIHADIHGGSLLGIFSKNEAALANAVDNVDKTSNFFISNVDEASRPSARMARLFADRAREICISTKRITRLAKRAGMQIALVGAAAKAITVLQVADLEIDRVFDEAPLKVGLYIPDTNLIIEPLQAISEVISPTLYIIGAWNFSSELADKINNLRNNDHPGGDVFCCYFPNIMLFE